MSRLILTYGIVAGLVVITFTILGVAFDLAHEWLGFLVMFIAFSTIYVAIRQHRDQALGGVITFRTGLLVGAGISAVAGIIYVAGWELYLAVTDYAFIQDYVREVLDARVQSGISATELAALHAEMDKMVAQYNNPLARIPITFIEIFPVGLLVSLVSAGILRNHNA